MPFAPGCFWSPYSRPTFLSIFPWSPLGKISENGRFRCPWQICYTRLYGHLWSRSLHQNVALCFSFKCIVIRRWCHLRQGVFEARIVGLLFWGFSLGSPSAKSQKMADFGVLAKFFITRLFEHLWSRSLHQNVVLCLPFTGILIRRWCHLRQGVFEARVVGLLFWAFSLGPSLANFQKMADLGVLAKFVITRLYGHLWSRSLHQNVVLCLPFKCLLIKRWCHLHQGVFEARIVGLLFWAFPLCHPLAKSQKMADLGASKAELWQVWQGQPHRTFYKILQRCDQAKLLQIEGHKNTLAQMPLSPKYNALQEQT